MVLHMVSQVEPRLLLHQPATAVCLIIQVVQVAERQQLPQWVENREAGGKGSGRGLNIGQRRQL